MKFAASVIEFLLTPGSEENYGITGTLFLVKH
jgi:hypothetical protein